MASSGQRSNPAAAGHGPHGRSRSQVPRHMLQIAMHCQPLLGDPSQLLLPKKRISQNYQGSQAPKMRLSDSVRLEDGIFRWPKIEDGGMRLSAAQFSALLEGLDWRRVHEARETATPTQPG